VRGAHRLGPSLAVACALVASALAGTARAEETAPAAKWPRRSVAAAASEKAVKVSVALRDVLASPASEKLGNGLLHTLTVRVALHDESDGRLVTASARSCRVRFDLWDEVYRVQVEAPGDARNLAFLAVDGVARQCAELKEFPLPLRAPLVPGRSYFVSVRADVNPADPEMIEHLRRWVTGASPTRTGGDALFGSLLGLFVRDFAKSERTLLFRGAPFAAP
jgi:hypothetical protein